MFCCYLVNGLFHPHTSNFVYVPYIGEIKPTYDPHRRLAQVTYHAFTLVASCGLPFWQGVAGVAYPFKWRPRLKMRCWTWKTPSFLGSMQLFSQSFGGFKPNKISTPWEVWVHLHPTYPPEHTYPGIPPNHPALQWLIQDFILLNCWFRVY